MSSLENYLLAVRPWSFTASMMPLLLGSALAYSSAQTLSILVLFLTCVSALCVHAAANLFNTYYDYIHGVDTPTVDSDNTKASDDRTLIEGLLKPNDVVRLGLILYTIGTIAFLLLSHFSPAKEPYLALIYFGALPLSFLYTGGIDTLGVCKSTDRKRFPTLHSDQTCLKGLTGDFLITIGFKYIALGDVLILLTFGPITIVYAFMAQAGHYSIYPVLYALPLTLNTEAILHSNNTRDMQHDKSVGILTLSILLGQRYSYYLYCLLIYSPYVIIGYMTINISWYCSLPLFTIFYARRLCDEFKRGELIRLPNRTAVLNFQLGFLYILSIVLTNSVTNRQRFVF